MASQVEICNRALTKLGVARVTSISPPDDNVQASLLAAIWDTVRKSELRKNFWSFAIKRVALPSLAEVPAFGFGLKYQLPSDFLRVIQIADYFEVPAVGDYINSNQAAYAIEAGSAGTPVVLCNYAAPLNLRYVYDATDPGLFDPLFVELLATKLAQEACEELTNSNTKKAQLIDEYKAIRYEAISINAIERPPTPMPDDSWVIRRL